MNPLGVTLTAGKVIISVWDSRAILSRYVAVKRGLSIEPARNWEELESAATDAVYSQGGALNLSGHYDCPSDLAAKAVFEEAREQQKLLLSRDARNILRLASKLHADMSEAAEAAIKEYYENHREEIES